MHAPSGSRATRQSRTISCRSPIVSAVCTPQLRSSSLIRYRYSGTLCASPALRAYRSCGRGHKALNLCCNHWCVYILLYFTNKLCWWMTPLQRLPLLGLGREGIAVVQVGGFLLRGNTEVRKYRSARPGASARASRYQGTGGALQSCIVPSTQRVESSFCM